MNQDFDVQEELKKLPKKPGVYIMHDADDTILYVGKAVNLHNRVRSYFKENIGRGPQIDKMVSLIARFEYIVTDSELEALVLENNLIKEYAPKYNTLLKDDKTYPYIKVTLGEEFPRIVMVRQMKKDKAKYFGPFTNGGVKETIDLINKLYLLRTCNRKLPKEIGKERPCLNYHINQCCAPCLGGVSQEEYAKRIEQAIEFLNGKQQPIIKELKEKMQAASENMEFEEAMKYRDLIENIKKVSESQKMSDNVGEDKDIIALAIDGNETVVQVFFLRNGKLIGREHFYMTQIEEPLADKILTSFVKQFYAGTPFIPREIMLQEPIEDMELVESWLTSRKGTRVHLRVPQKGAKEKLVDLAARNAQLVLSQDRERIRREEGRTIGAVKEIEELLGIGPLTRMEAFDISNTSGFANVGSMVVYEKGKPKRSDYRKFRMKTVAGPDDYACMHEVLTRRFQHGLDEREELKNAENGMEEQFGSFTKFPDLLLMDGGRGQVNIALQVLEELDISIPVCGMVKDDNHRTRGLYFNNMELPIDRNSEGFKLITRIQDEAHRFAITYHRSLRSKVQVHSVLEEIPGVGPSRRKALMKYFKSIEEMRAANVDTLLEVPGITTKVAEKIYAFFQQAHETDAEES
ncbi:MAG: excinuclease ABC subunit UvrC [Lachnospiraceae bacterium]|jgi:excinuclease ABC subunit C|nr:excinuclease ABC subunit UvrC [Lachnospiraceae bacterium]